MVSPERLKTVTKNNSLVAQYTYDLLDRKYQTSIINGPTTRYCYDGDQILCQYNVDNNNEILTKKFVYGPGIDNPIRMTVVKKPDLNNDNSLNNTDLLLMAESWLLRHSDSDFNSYADLNSDNIINNVDLDLLANHWQAQNNQAVYCHFYYHFDGSASVSALSDSLGKVAEAYFYDVYGNVRVVYDPAGPGSDWYKSSGTSGINFGNFSLCGNPYYFTARQLDRESGLYYYRARHYSPNIGRFLQTDPIGYGDGLNWYAYCGNNPIMFADPLGLCGSGNSWDNFVDYSNDVLGYQTGYLDSIKNTINGIKYVKQHPASTAVALYNSVVNYRDTWNAIKSNYSNLASIPRGQGQITGEILQTAIGAAGVASKLATASRASGLARSSSKVSQVASKAASFFDDSFYSNKVINQMSGTDFHSFPNIVENFSEIGQVIEVVGGDGSVYSHLSIPGTYKGYDGAFKFIKGPDGKINHRMFELGD